MRTFLVAVACAGALALVASTASAETKAEKCDDYATHVANSQANVGGQTAGAAVFGALAGLGIGAATGNNLGTSAAIGAGVGGVAGFAVGSAEWNKVRDAAFADCMSGGVTPVSSQTGQYEPWTDEWFAYCEAKYKSFTPSDGTFQPFGDVPRKLCQ